MGNVITIVSKNPLTVNIEHLTGDGKINTQDTVPLTGYKTCRQVGNQLIIFYKDDTSSTFVFLDEKKARSAYNDLRQIFKKCAV